MDYSGEELGSVVDSLHPDHGSVTGSFFHLCMLQFFQLLNRDDDKSLRVVRIQ